MPLMPPQRKSSPFGFPMTPFDPGAGGYLPLTDPRLIRAFTVVEELGDYLSCTDEYGGVAYVAKPPILRRTPFDGQTVNSISYVYSAANTREATGGETSETQEITPDYYAGETVLGLYRNGVLDDPDEALGTDGIIVYWTDLNTAGRCWAVSQE